MINRVEQICGQCVWFKPERPQYNPRYISAGVLELLQSGNPGPLPPYWGTCEAPYQRFAGIKVPKFPTRANQVCDARDGDQQLLFKARQ